MKTQRSIDQLELTAVGTLDQQSKPRRRGVDTSRAARAKAHSTRTEELRELIVRTIEACERDPRMRGATADEVHQLTAGTERERHDVRRIMEIRRRVSDLHNKFNRLRDTNVRRVNDCGNAMIVWETCNASV